MPSYKDWIKLVDINIDYYSAFVKAWIAFNSWYRSEYQEITDRDVIDTIKARSNPFKNYIVSLLDVGNDSEEALFFRANLEHLRIALTEAAIVTQERNGICTQISFAEIATTNPKNQVETDYRYTHYSIRRTRTTTKTVVAKKNDRLAVLFSLEQDNYDMHSLEVHADFQRLTEEQRGQCLALYREVCPYVVESILETDENDTISFSSDRDKTSRGIIEVLYLLRCSMLHGNIFPNEASNRVYKYAYSVLATVLKKML